MALVRYRSERLLLQRPDIVSSPSESGGSDSSSLTWRWRSRARFLFNQRQTSGSGWFVIRNSAMCSGVRGTVPLAVERERDTGIDVRFLFPFLGWGGTLAAALLYASHSRRDFGESNSPYLCRKRGYFMLTVLAAPSAFPTLIAQAIVLFCALRGADDD